MTGEPPFEVADGRRCAEVVSFPGTRRGHTASLPRVQYVHVCIIEPYGKKAGCIIQDLG